MNRAIVVGSPRVNGRSAALAEELFEACIEEYPDDQISLIPLSSVSVEPCTGCDFCKKSENHACCIEDDMDDVREVLDEADELTIVSPVYFAGPPATLKAFLDRLQPYFWTDARRGDLRPAVLHVIGEGHDPFGFEPLVGTVKSAAFTAGFKLERVMNWVGKIDVQGEIIEDAQVEDVLWPDSFGASADGFKKEGSAALEASKAAGELVETASKPAKEGSPNSEPAKKNSPISEPPLPKKPQAKLKIAQPSQKNESIKAKSTTVQAKGASTKGKNSSTKAKKNVSSKAASNKAKSAPARTKQKSGSSTASSQLRKKKGR